MCVLLDQGLPRPVTGTAWIDHQWGDFISIASGGWDWYSVHLDDGRDFTASVVRDELGATGLQYGTLVGPGGETTHLPRGLTWRFGQPAAGPVRTRVRSILRAGRSRSPATVCTYAWDPLLLDQELDTRGSTGVAYWEGAVSVRRRRRRRLACGYVELTGYGPPPSAA